ncbi:hypothetical protein PUR_00970 [Paenibacillus sp. URB8-2]|nr:hypothetical protein PUR_00970 [Paenibacillus sp. URB8-2]
MLAFAVLLAKIKLFKKKRLRRPFRDGTVSRRNIRQNNKRTAYTFLYFKKKRLRRPFRDGTVSRRNISQNDKRTAYTFLYFKKKRLRRPFRDGTVSRRNIRQNNKRTAYTFLYFKKKRLTAFLKDAYKPLIYIPGKGVRHGQQAAGWQEADCFEYCERQKQA